MMRWVALGLPLLLGGYVLTIPTGGTLPVLVTAGMALALAGAALRRYGLLAAGAVVLLFCYLGALLAAARPLEFWAAFAAFVIVATATAGLETVLEFDGATGFAKAQAGPIP